MHIDKKIKLDLTIFLFFLPLLLFIIYILPDNLQHHFVLFYDNPTIFSLFFKNYTHRTFFHFASNIGMYYFTAIPILYLNLKTDRKRFYKVNFLLFIVLPFIISLSFLFTIGAPGKNSVGFSGIVSALLGFLPVSIIYFLRDYCKIRFTDKIIMFLMAILFVNLTIITMIYDAYLAVIPLIMLISIFLYYSRGDIKNIVRNVFTGIKKEEFFERYLLFWAFLLSIIGVFMLFPQKIVGENSTTNILAHYIGYTFGFFIPIFIDKKLRWKFRKKE